MDATKAPKIAEMTYEQARDELVEIVNRLEQGSLTLDESISLWERGEALANRCEEHLLGARQRLEAAARAREAESDDAGDETASVAEDLA